MRRLLDMGDNLALWEDEAGELVERGREVLKWPL